MKCRDSAKPEGQMTAVLYQREIAANTAEIVIHRGLGAVMHNMMQWCTTMTRGHDDDT